MNKEQLIETIQIKHRQLMCYLFFFERNNEGRFVPANRPKFSYDEMAQPGVIGAWSVKDLLAHLLDWEQRLVRWIRAGPNDTVPELVPPADLHWNKIDIADFELPPLASTNSLEVIVTDIKIHYKEVISVIEEIPEEKLLVSGEYQWTGSGNIANFVAICTYDHYDWAKRHVRTWRRTHAGEFLNKKIVLERIQVERRRLDKNLRSLSDEQLQEPGVIGNWSAKDVLAHLAEWEQLFIGWYQAGLQDEVPEIPVPGISWEELDTVNLHILERPRDRGLQEIVN